MTDNDHEEVPEEGQERSLEDLTEEELLRFVIQLEKDRAETADATETKSKTFDEIKEDVRRFAGCALDVQPRDPNGWGYLWAFIEGTRTLICSVDGRANHDEIVETVNKHPSVESVWINED